MNFPFHETLYHYSRSDRNLILHFQNFGSPNLTSKFSFGLEGTQLLKNLQKALITLDHQKSWIFAHHLLLWGNDFLQASWSIVKWNFSTQPAKSFYGFLIELYCSLHVLDIKKFRESTAFCTFGKKIACFTRRSPFEHHKVSLSCCDPYSTKGGQIRWRLLWHRKV